VEPPNAYAGTRYSLDTVAGNEMIVRARERQFHSVATKSLPHNRARTRWRTWAGTGGTRENQRIEPGSRRDPVHEFWTRPSRGAAGERGPGMLF